MLVRACAETVTDVPPVAGSVRYASTEDLPAADLCPIAPEHADTVFEFVPSLTASVPADVLKMNPLNELPVRVTVTCVPGDGEAPPSCVSACPPAPDCAEAPCPSPELPANAEQELGPELWASAGEASNVSATADNARNRHVIMVAVCRVDARRP